MTNLKQTAILAIAMLTTPHVDMRAETWTLENCVSYALTHNLSVKARQLNIESGQLQLTEAKDRFLPSLNASAGESLNFGRGQTTHMPTATQPISNGELLSSYHCSRVCRNTGKSKWRNQTCSSCSMSMRPLKTMSH